MRNLALITLFVSALVGCDSDSNTNTGAIDGPGDHTTEGGDTNGNNADGVDLLSPQASKFYIDRTIADSDGVELIDGCDGVTQCVLSESFDDGQSYRASLVMAGYVTADQIVTETDDQIDWSGEGMRGVEFDARCTDQNGNELNLVTTKVKDDFGNERVVLDGTVAGTDMTLTNTTLYGNIGDLTMTGEIFLTDMTIELDVSNGDKFTYTCR